jgi:hypothetical protein
VNENAVTKPVQKRPHGIARHIWGDIYMALKEEERKDED